MLRRVQVDGFRSLNGFSLDIRSGPNVLVGPNGSGKSNILRFMDFLKDLQTYRLSEAVSKGGGAGTLFTRKAADKIARQISFAIDGSGSFVDSDLFSDSAAYSSLYVFYSYEAVIRLDDDNRLVYGPQVMRLKVAERGSSREETDWTFVVRTEKGEFSVKENNIERDLTYVSREHIHYYVNRLAAAQQNNPYGPYSLITCLSQFAVTGISKVLTDISAGQVYNIIPSRVREPEDIAREPIVKADGSGLAATLLELRNREREASYPKVHYYFGYAAERAIPGSYEEVKQHFLNMNRNITDIDIREDSFENNIKLSVKVACGSEEVDMPFSFMSDGTVKWLVLVTAVITASSYICMEEPENFIHPNLQSETAEFIRTRCRQSEELFALVTTHSQTFLDDSKPEELVNVSMYDGVTSASRLEEVELITAEISRTGFGLGYYYISESL